MMKWIGLAIQLLLIKKSVDKTKLSLGQLEKAAFYFKKFLCFFVGIFFSSLFMIVAIVVAILDFGLQLDRSGGVVMSGLMYSALIFFGISLSLGLLSVLYLYLSRRHAPVVVADEFSSPPAMQWLDVADSLLKTLLKNPKI